MQAGCWQQGILTAWAPGQLSTHQRLSLITRTVLPGPGRDPSPAGALLLAPWVPGVQPPAQCPHSPGTRLGRQGSGGRHCEQDEPVQPQLLSAGEKCSLLLQWPEGSSFSLCKELWVIQSQEDSAAIWGTLCPVPIPRLPWPHVHSPAPSIPGSPRKDRFLLVGRCWGSAQASFGGLVLGRVTLAEGITAVSHGRDMAGVGNPWWPCPTPWHAQPPAQGRLSSCRTGALSHTMGTGHLAGHWLPAKPTLSPSTQKQGHRALEPLAVRILPRSPKSCSLQQNAHSGPTGDTQGDTWVSCPGQGRAAKLWQCRVPIKPCSTRPGWQHLPLPLHLSAFTAASPATWQH